MLNVYCFFGGLALILLVVIPIAYKIIKDEQKFTDFYGDMWEYVTCNELGYTDEEINEFADSLSYGYVEMSELDALSDILGGEYA